MIYPIQTYLHFDTLHSLEYLFDLLNLAFVYTFLLFLNLESFINSSGSGPILTCALITYRFTNRRDMSYITNVVFPKVFSKRLTA